MRCVIVDCFADALDESVRYSPGIGVTGLCASHWNLPESERAELMVDAKRVRETDAEIMDAIVALEKVFI